MYGDLLTKIRLMDGLKMGTFGTLVFFCRDYNKEPGSGSWTAHLGHQLGNLAAQLGGQLLHLTCGIQRVEACG